MKGWVLLIFAFVLSSCAGHGSTETVLKSAQPSGPLLKKDDPYVPLESADLSKLPTELEPVSRELMTLNPMLKRSAKRNPAEAKVMTPAEFPVSLIFSSVETDISNCEKYSQGKIRLQCRNLAYTAVRDFVSMMRDSRIKPYLKQAVIDDLKSDHYLNLFNASRLAYEVAERCKQKNQSGYVRLYWHAVPCNGQGDKLSFMAARRKKLIN